ncbi:hypothetical protein OQJ13_01910 [Legionella sp. PATHC035]|uniref:hypothetical protein n=1 Tax=Legionella sp. PATHC035 TaxID=2992040 RepID=UPI0022432C79|nr:hypothetical protein [Legionella sp. PATHC035]MCW8407730.1 hypothetical protein [Legionella sp. PATHC035]
MRNSNQKNQDPFDELADEMLLEVLNARDNENNYIIDPKDMASVALSCKRFNSISQSANCLFFPVSYRDLREKASDYRDFKEKQLSQLRREQKMIYEKSGPIYWNKTIRKAIACGLGLLAASFLAYQFDMEYSQFFLTTIAFALMTLIINELLSDHFQYSLDQSKTKKIPLQFFDEEIARKTVSFGL